MSNLIVLTVQRLVNKNKTKITHKKTIKNKKQRKKEKRKPSRKLVALK